MFLQFGCSYKHHQERTFPQTSTHVTLKIYDVLGKEIATLVNETQSAGRYTVDWNAGKNPSGIYFYKLSAGDFVSIKKMG